MGIPFKKKWLWRHFGAVETRHLETREVKHVFETKELCPIRFKTKFFWVSKSKLRVW